jgi:hypothetical protein
MAKVTSEKKNLSRLAGEFLVAVFAERCCQHGGFREGRCDSVSRSLGSGGTPEENWGEVLVRWECATKAGSEPLTHMVLLLIIIEKVKDDL